MDKKVDDLEEIDKRVSEMSMMDFYNFTLKDLTNNELLIARKYLRIYLDEWSLYLYKQELTDGLNNSKINEDMKYSLKKQVDDFSKETHGAYYRKESLVHIIGKVRPTHVEKLACIVFSIQKKGSDTPTNYAYLYSDINCCGVEDTIQFNIVHKYFCIGPNIISSDGEFREKFNSIDMIDFVYQQHADLVEEVEEYLMNRPDVTLEQAYYLPVELEDTHIIRNNIKAHRFIIRLYVLSWVTQLYIKHINLQNRYVDPVYNKNMFDEEDDRFMAHLIEKYTIQEVRLFYWEGGHVNARAIPVQDPKKRNNPTLGQKIILLEKDNIESDILSDAWKELHIAQLLSDLVLNNITPSISITYDWIYIYNINKKLFNNKNMTNRIQLSDELAQQEVTQESTDNVISDNAITVISEYVGRPINDIAHSMESEVFRKSIGSLFDGVDKFSKYLFEITYALLCVNTKFNVIHGDLHLNNTTLYHIHKTYITNKSLDNTKYTYYVIEDKIYRFEATSRYGMLIDYSRSFIIPKEKNTKHQLSQAEKIMGYYEKLFPTFYEKNEDKLRQLIKEDFARVYKTFTAIDMYIHTDRLLKYIDKYGKLIRIHKDNTELIKKANKLSKGHLMAVFDPAKWYPNMDILTKCFGNYLTKKVEGTLEEIFFYENKINYSLGQYERVPPRYTRFKMKKPNTNEIADFPNAERLEMDFQKYYDSRVKY